MNKKVIKVPATKNCLTCKRRAKYLDEKKHSFWTKKGEWIKLQKYIETAYEYRCKFGHSTIIVIQSIFKPLNNNLSPTEKLFKKL